MKILSLGNEFINEDSLAKKVAQVLNQEGIKIIPINDSFQLMEQFSDEKIIIIDVVKNLDKITQINISDLKSDSILTAHDFDAGYIINLLGNKDNTKIIGIPMSGDIKVISKEIKAILNSFNSD